MTGSRATPDDQELIVIGAGAIGRGFLPWCFQRSRLVFVDTNPAIVGPMKARKRYTTYRARGGGLDELLVPVAAISGPRTTRTRPRSSSALAPGMP